MCLYPLLLRAEMRIGLLANVQILVSVSAIIHTAEISNFAQMLLTFQC